MIITHVIRPCWSYSNWLDTHIALCIVPRFHWGSCIQNSWGQKVFALLFIHWPDSFWFALFIPHSLINCNSNFRFSELGTPPSDPLISSPLPFKLKCLYIYFILCLDEPEITLAQSYVIIHKTYPLINIQLCLPVRSFKKETDGGGQQLGGYRRLFFRSISLDERPIRFLHDLKGKQKKIINKYTK